MRLRTSSWPRTLYHKMLLNLLAPESSEARATLQPCVPSRLRFPQPLKDKLGQFLSQYLVEAPPFRGLPREATNSRLRTSRAQTYLLFQNFCHQFPRTTRTRATWETQGQHHMNNNSKGRASLEKIPLQRQWKA